MGDLQIFLVLAPKALDIHANLAKPLSKNLALLPHPTIPYKYSAHQQRVEHRFPTRTSESLLSPAFVHHHIPRHSMPYCSDIETVATL